MNNLTSPTTPNGTAPSTFETGPKMTITTVQWVLVLIGYPLIIMMALLGNSMIIVIIQRNQRMKNATSYLIVNLSVSEILSTSVIMVVSWVVRVIQPNRIPYYNEMFAVIFCKTMNFLDSFCHDLAIMSMTVIALDRFFAVKFPLRKIITRGRAKKIIGVIWILAFGATSINLYSAKYANKDGNVHCPRDWAPLPPNSEMIFVIIQMVLFYVVPLCIMGVLYSITVYKLWIRRIPGNVTAANQRLEHQTKVNVLKMCITVVVVFTLCWLPLYVIRVITSPLPKNLVTSVVFLSFTSYAINPLIYFIFSQDYRNGFKDIIRPLQLLCNRLPRLFSKSQAIGVGLSNTSIMYNSNVEILSIRNLRERADNKL